jgi:hydroxyacylglutathione hydrolase
MRTSPLLVVGALFAACALSPTDDRTLRVALPDGVLETGGAPFPTHWIDGTSPDEPHLQVHWYDADTVILRQSKRVHYEAPFMYLLFGTTHALLLDTGAKGDFDLRGTIDVLMAEREASIGHPLTLVVTHTHGHSDHVAHDDDFAERENTIVVPRTIETRMDFFAIEQWPVSVGWVDLGQRRIEVLPTPGHHPSHLAFWDARTNVILSGDTFYPGYLFVFEPRAWSDFAASTRRLLAFAEQRGVTTFLGGHVEMSSTPGVGYPYRTIEQPEETPLALSIDDLRATVAALVSQTEPGFVTMDRVVLYPAFLDWDDQADDAVDDAGTTDSAAGVEAQDGAAK